jgi:hypothetical protein
MLEKRGEKNISEQEGLDERQVFQRTVAGFIDSVPEKGPLYEKGEMVGDTIRAITFGQLFKSFIIICDGAKNLNREQRSKVLKRLETLKREASFWTGKTDPEIDFVEEIKEMSQSILWK